jgi:hypothetical protein
MSRSALQLLVLCLLTISYLVIREKNMLHTLKKVKFVGWFLITLMLWVYGGGRVHAENYTTHASRAVAIANLDNQFDALLSEIKDVVKRAGTKTKAEPEKGFQDIGKLNELKKSLIKEHEKVQNYFSQLESFIKEKKLPSEILNRQQEFVRGYQAKYEALMENLRRIESAQDETTGFWARLTGKSKKVDWDGVLGKTLSFLEENAVRPRETHFDPKNLPHRSLKADKPIAPKLTREEWLKAFPKEAEAKLISAQSLSAKAKGSITLAATTPPTSADLAETIEVQFTPEIRQLADSLGRNPVKIFNWVRNNIEFVPTWGSIQGAPLCLENRAGNAFDTASLLISLLRYSGIAARYQMGTITVPINKVTSWLGGVTDPTAAAVLLSSGGVPSEVITDQGVFVKIRLEHVWVKTSVAYIPSGGAVNGQANSWVEMDPSFKQYTVVEGLDLSSQVTFNRDQYLSSPSTISPMDFYLQQVQNYLSINLPGRTLNEVLRKESIIRREYSILAASLPYTQIVKGQEFSIIPGSLRQTIKFEAFSNEFLRDLDFSYTISLPELSGKRVTLSYMPTDPDVAQRFNGMYSAPPYLMRLRPVLRIDGAIRAQGQGAGRFMGETQLFSISLNMPGGLGEEVIENELTAGGYHAIVLNPQKITQATVDKTSYDQIITEDERLYGTLNIDNSDRDALYGAVLNGLGLLYFQRLDQVKQQAAALYKIRNLNRTYLGMFAFDLSARFLFGRPTTIAINRLTMDVDRIVDAPVSVKGDQTAARELTILTGFYSSFLEHAIFDGDMSANGFSAVKALQQARATGLQVININASNADALLPQLNVAAEIRSNILDNVNRGRIVTIPQEDVVIGTLRGVGYTVLDPETGDGSYLISVPHLLAGGDTEYFVQGLSGWTQSIPVYGPFLGPQSFPNPCQNGNRPVAILIMGNGSGTGIMEWLSGLDRGNLDKVARILYAAGYEVAASRVATKEAFLSVIKMVQGFEFVLESQCQPRLDSNGAPVKRANIFIYIGHAVTQANLPSDLGILSLNPGSSDPASERLISPTDVSVVRDAFRVVYLSGCQTGVAQDAWAGSFGASLLLGHGDNLPVSAATGNYKDAGYAACVAMHLTTGGTGADARSCLHHAPYCKGDLAVTLTPCNVCSFNPNHTPLPCGP